MDPLHLLDDCAICHRIERVMCVVLFVHNIACLTLFSHHLCTNKRKIFRIEWLALFSLTCCVILSGSIIGNLYPFRTTDTMCIYVLTWSTSTYAILKYSIYNFFLHRLFMINKRRFTNFQIKLSRICLFVWLSINIFFCIMYGSNSYYSIEHQICSPRFPPYVPALVSLVDLIISITISVLLCRALLSMANVDDNFILLKKFVLLSFIAIITTQISLIVTIILSFGSFWLTLDSAIAAWCVLLTFGHNKRLVNVYNLLCGRCHGCFRGNCLLCFACNCCCSVAKNRAKANSKSSQHTTTTDISTMASSMTGDSTTTDSTTITTIKVNGRSNSAIITKLEPQSIRKNAVNLDEQIAVDLQIK